MTMPTFIYISSPMERNARLTYVYFSRVLYLHRKPQGVSTL
jgi:hypothetical protein